MAAFAATFVTRLIASASLVCASVDTAIGVVLVLAAVALAAVLFRQQLLRLLAARPRVVDTRTIQVTAGLILVAVAWNAIVG